MISALGTLTLLAIATGSLVLVAMLAVGWYLSYTAVRLDRLHTRVEATAAALDAQLVRRAQAATEVAYLAEVDAASAALLLDAARDALEHAGAWTQDRLESESALTQTLTLTCTDLDPDEAQVIEECASRVRLARRFHNEAVDTTRALRQQPLVQVLRLAGHTDMPERVEFADGSP